MHSIILEFANEFCCLNHSYEFSASYLVIDPKLFRMTEFLFCLDEIYYFETLISAIQNLSTQILLRICKKYLPKLYLRMPKNATTAIEY